MAWQRISPEVTVKGPMQWIGLMIICFGMTVKRIGTLVVGVRKMKALTVKMETVPLTGKSRQHLIYFVY
jgi:hypothetical protein